MEVSYSGDIYTILASYEILCEEEEQKAKADRVKYRIVKGLNQSGKPIFRIIETPPFGKRVAIRAADILKAMATTPYRQTEERLVELALHRLRIDSDKSVNNMVRQRLIEECISVDRDLLNDLLNDFSSLPPYAQHLAKLFNNLEGNYAKKAKSRFQKECEEILYLFCVVHKARKYPEFCKNVTFFKPRDDDDKLSFDEVMEEISKGKTSFKQVFLDNFESLEEFMKMDDFREGAWKI